MSPTNKPSFVLPANTAHVWTAHLDEVAPEDLAALATLLEPDEAARAERFHFERDRRHFTVTRGFLRRLLSQYLEVPASALRFGYGPRGKPFLVSPGTCLRFNLSHSHGRALFVFALDREVGIDVEAGARLGEDWPGIARRVFSAREQAELFALPEGSRREGFLNGWTRKEAYLKATGLGIVDGLQTIEVTLAPQVEPTLLAAPAGLNWTIHDLRADAVFAAALVISGTGPIIIQHHVCASVMDAVDDHSPSR